MRAFEKLSRTTPSNDEKIQILDELTKVESFNTFLNEKLKTSKRFGVEGVCSVILGLSKKKIFNFR